ncbi:MAG: phage major capsid protein [Simkania sp.]|nr:phage major capsid protein [Simkania sp.]
MSENVNAPSEQDLYEEIKSNLKTELKSELVAEMKTQFSRKGLPAVAKAADDRTFGEWLALVGKTARNSTREKAFNMLSNKYDFKTTTDMVQSTDGVGGFTVPEIWSNELFKLDGYESLNSRARQIAMPTDVTYIPVLDQTATPGGGGESAFNGGLLVGIVNEAAEPTDSTNLTFKQVKLQADKAMGFVEVSNELLQNNNVGLESVIVDGFRQTLSSYMDYVILNGNGANSDGIIGNGATITVQRDTSNQFKFHDARNMIAAHKRLNNGAGAAWVIHPYHLASLLGFESSLGQAIWLQNANAANGLQMYLLGYPVLVSEYTAGIGAEGDVLLLDLGAYALGVNRSITIEASPHVSFKKDCVVYRGVARFAGMSLLSDPVTLADGTSTVSPFVVLDDQSS